MVIRSSYKFVCKQLFFIPTCRRTRTGDNAPYLNVLSIRCAMHSTHLNQGEKLMIVLETMTMLYYDIVLSVLSVWSVWSVWRMWSWNSDRIKLALCGSVDFFLFFVFLCFSFFLLLVCFVG